MAEKRGPKRPPESADGAALKRLRTARGWSQQHLHRTSGVPQSVIQKLEAGTRTVTLTVARALCQALDVSLAVFDATAAPDPPAPGHKRNGRPAAKGKPRGRRPARPKEDDSVPIE